jgi:hypothetical protein
LLLEHPADRAGGSQVAVETGEDVADLACRTVAVVGHDLDDYGHAARPKHLVGEFLVVHAFEIARALLDGPVDRVVGHVHAASLLDRRAEPRIAVDVTATEARRDGELLEELGPQLRPSRVGSLLLVLDLGPTIVP